MNLNLSFSKCVVLAHAGQQSSFKRAAALSKGDLLSKYVTTVYLKKKNTWIVGLLKLFSHTEAQRLEGRNCDELEDEEVLQFYILRNLLLILLNRSVLLTKCYQLFNRIFSIEFAQKTAKYAMASKARMLIMMGNAPSAAFRILLDNASDIIKVFDMTSVAYNYQSKVMSEEKGRLPPKWDRRIIVDTDQKEISRLMQNIYLADYIIVPSRFAKETLINNGVSTEKIRVVNYGFDRVNKCFFDRETSGPLKLLYVGSLSFEKGVHYLVEAIKRFSNNTIKLTLVGKNYLPEEVFDNTEQTIECVYDIPHNEVFKYYQKADVFITASLFDSFGKVVTEALSFGLPVICTTSTGASDYISERENGIIIPPADVESIVDAIQYFLDNRDRLPEMSKHAFNTADVHTWDLYEKEYISVIKRMLVEKVDG